MYPLAPPTDDGACRTPRPALYFFWQGLPFMSVCASPFENGALIHIRLRQTHSTSACRDLLKERQTKQLVACAFRTPSSLDDIGWRRLPVMPQLTFPVQFELATKIFIGQTRAPTCDRQISHCCYGQSFMKSSPLVVALPAPATFPVRTTLHIGRACFPVMSVSAHPQERRPRVLVSRRQTPPTTFFRNLTQFF